MTKEPFKYVSAEEKPDHDPANYTANQSQQKQLNVNNQPQGRQGDLPSESSKAEDEESDKEALNIDAETDTNA